MRNTKGRGALGSVQKERMGTEAGTGLSKAEEEEVEVAVEEELVQGCDLDSSCAMSELLLMTLVT